jgi:hypothetical protein
MAVFFLLLVASLTILAVTARATDGASFLIRIGDNLIKVAITIIAMKFVVDLVGWLIMMTGTWPGKVV